MYKVVASFIQSLSGASSTPFNEDQARIHNDDGEDGASGADLTDKRESQLERLDHSLGKPTQSATKDHWTKQLRSKHVVMRITNNAITKNNAQGGLWVAMGDSVLDLKDFQFHHPGGRLALQQFHHGHEDAYKAFLRAGHSKHAQKVLESLKIGVLVKEQDGANQVDLWRELIVFVINVLATTVTFLSYWGLICNRDSGLLFATTERISTIGELMIEIFTKIYVPTQLLLSAGFLADFLLLKDCRDNFLRLTEAGFTFPYILFCMAIVFFFSSPTLGVILWVLLEDSEPYFNFALILKVGAVFLASEILFTKLHTWMHQETPHLHTMHHCCQYSTATTGLIFDPEDYLLEFWASKFPILVVLGTELFGAYDGFACIVAMGIAILNDICNHDAWMRTGHYYHHLDVSTGYGLLNLPFFPSKADQLDGVHKVLDEIFG